MVPPQPVLVLEARSRAWPLQIQGHLHSAGQPGIPGIPGLLVARIDQRLDVTPDEARDVYMSLGETPTLLSSLRILIEHSVSMSYET